MLYTHKTQHIWELNVCFNGESLIETDSTDKFQQYRNYTQHSNYNAKTTQTLNNLKTQAKFFERLCWTLTPHITKIQFFYYAGF